MKTFDPNLGYTLSTYVSKWISQGINRAIYTGDRQIRTPEGWEPIKRKYNKLITTYCAMNKPLPSVEELANILGTTERTIRKIQNAYKFEPSSLDMKVDDNEKTDMSNFVGTQEQGYEEVLNSIVYREYLAVLKNILSKHSIKKRVFCILF